MMGQAYKVGRSRGLQRGKDTPVQLDLPRRGDLSQYGNARKLVAKCKRIPLGTQQSLGDAFLGRFWLRLTYL